VDYRSRIFKQIQPTNPQQIKDFHPEPASAIIRAHRIFDSLWRSNMAERSRTRRNTLERRCLGKAFKRLFIGSPKRVFKMLEAIKKV